MCVNSPSSQVPAAESSEPTCSAGGPSDTSNGTTTVSACSPLESLTDLSPAPPSLATCVSSYSPVPLTSTADLLTWLQQAFPASRSAEQEPCSELKTSGICGRQQRSAFASFDQNACGWRTSQTSFPLGTSHECWLAWPRWGTWDLGADCCRRRKRHGANVAAMCQAISTMADTQPQLRGARCR